MAQLREGASSAMGPPAKARVPARTPPLPLRKTRRDRVGELMADLSRMGCGDCGPAPDLVVVRRAAGALPCLETRPAREPAGNSGVLHRRWSNAQGTPQAAM